MEFNCARWVAVLVLAVGFFVAAISIYLVNHSDLNDLESSVNTKIAALEANRDNFDEITFGANTEPATLTGLVQDSGALVVVVNGSDVISSSPQALEIDSEDVLLTAQALHMAVTNSVVVDTPKVNFTGDVRVLDKFRATNLATFENNVDVQGALFSTDFVATGNSHTNGNHTVDDTTKTLDLEVARDASVTGTLRAGVVEQNGNFNSVADQFIVTAIGLVLNSQLAEPSAGEPCAKGQVAFTLTRFYLCTDDDVWSFANLTIAT